MNTTEAKRMEAFRKRKLMWQRADAYLKGSDVNLHQLTADVKELLTERRKMAETIRDLRKILGNVNIVLIASNVGYEMLKDDLRKAVMGEREDEQA